MRKRILYISEIFPDPARNLGVWGGGEKQFYEVSRRISKLGHDVSVLTCRFPGQPQIETSEGITIYRSSLSRDPKTGSATQSPAPASYILHSALRSIRIETMLIHCNTYFPTYVGSVSSFFKRVPIVATFHDIYGLDGWIASQQSKFWGLMGHFVATSTARLPYDRMIAVSPQCKNKLVSLGVPEQKITIIPNGVNLDLFDATTPKKVPKQILYVGRLVNFKHVDWLITAFAAVSKTFPESRLKIVGDGPERGNLEELSNKLGLASKVHFTGLTPSYSAVAQHFKESEVFVLPSTVEGEAIAVKEAMAAHLPVIAMKVPGSGVLSLVTNNKNGILVNPENIEMLRDAILDLLSDERKRIMLGSAGRNSVEKFDWNIIADRTLQVYEEVS